MGKANKHQLVQTLTNLDSEVETYDIKIAVKNKGKHDIRLKFVDQKPEIMAVKRDEEKLLITDILCLHRYSRSIQTFSIIQSGQHLGDGGEGCRPHLYYQIVPVSNPKCSRQ